MMDADWLGAVLVSTALSGLLWWQLRRGRAFGRDRVKEPRLFWMKISDLVFWLVLALGIVVFGAWKDVQNLH
jgi:hypothetical protein